MLRAGGYFAWAAQPVCKHEPILEGQWEGTKSRNSCLRPCSIYFKLEICKFSFPLLALLATGTC